MNTPSNILPRFDLQEPAFRKYEKFIARALDGSYELDPKVELGVKPISFICRFKDAILGFRRHKYTSQYFTQDAPFDKLKLYATIDGKVSIVNNAIEQSINDPDTLHAERDFSKIVEIAKQLNDKTLLKQFTIKYDNDVQRKAICNLEMPVGDYNITVRIINNHTLVIHP